MSGGFVSRMRFMREHRWTGAHLSEYLDEGLPAHGQDRLDQHLGACPECRRLLQGLRRALDGLRSMRSEPESAPGSAGIADSVIERLRDER
ncbi:hypothetical protein BH10ACT11_BH10ACT11_03570 [soil metagenome]